MLTPSIADHEGYAKSTHVLLWSRCGSRCPSADHGAPRQTMVVPGGEMLRKVALRLTSHHRQAKTHAAEPIYLYIKSRVDCGVCGNTQILHSVLHIVYLHYILSRFNYILWSAVSRGFYTLWFLVYGSRC